MLKYVLKRVAMLVPILVGVTVVVFLAMHLLPGDVLVSILGPQNGATPEVQAQIRRSLGLDRPLHVQYATWVWHALQGDFGASILSNKPVLGELLRRLPVTAELALLSLVLAIVLGVPLGVLSATTPNGIFDGVVRISSLFGLSIPGFWIGTLFLMGASLYVPSWPTLGYVELPSDPIGNLKTMLLPTLALSPYLVAGTMRMTRSAMLEVLRSDYITAARARGAREGIVVFKHALKNALIPVVTLLGLWLGALLGGAVIIETVFTLPGIGQMLVTAIQARDYPVVQGTVLFLATSFVLVNLGTDVLYGLLDPRVRYE